MSHLLHDGAREMPDYIQNNFIRGLMEAEFDLNATDDIRAILCMTNTTADSVYSANLTGLTVDESDATGYSRITMTTETVTADTGNNRVEFDADNLSFSGMSGDATRNYQGVLIYKHVDGTAGNDIPLFFVNFTNAPVTSTATQVDVTWDVEGIFRITSG
jgi:hypothetical protein